MNAEVVAIPAKMHDAVVDAAVKTFAGKGMPDAAVRSIIESEPDWSLSRLLLVDGRLAGFYLLAPGSITQFQSSSEEDLSRYRGKKGVEGVALVVLPEFRRNGYGDLLKNLPKKLGFDYVYGMQLKSLNNLDSWLKRRRLIADLGSCYVTLEDLK